MLHSRPYVPAARLHQAVGVEHERGPGRGGQLDGLEVDAAHADRRVRRQLQHLGRAVDVQQNGRRVARVRRRDAVRDRVVHRVQAGRHPVRAQPLGLLVEVVQHLLRRQVQPGQRLHRRPQLAHDRRGGRRVPHHVADDERDPAAGKRDRVVPVAADAGRLRGREITAGQPHTGRLRQIVGQHGALQLVGDRRLAPVQHRLVHPERRVRRQLLRDLEVLGLERFTIGPAEEDRGADHPAPPAQRRDDGPLPLGQRHRAGQLAQRGPGHLRLHEHRAHPAQHFGERPVAPDLDQGGRAGQDRQHRTGAVGARVALRAQLADRAEGQRLGNAVGAAQLQHPGRHRLFVADRQRVPEVDEDRVGERRHGGAAQAEHDLVQVHAPGDATGGGPHEPQPVGVAHPAVQPLARSGARGRLLRGFWLGAGVRQPRAVGER